MIRAQCPACRGIVQVADQHAGGVVACGRCRKALRVPAAPRARTRRPPGKVSRLGVLLAVGVSMAVLAAAGATAGYLLREDSKPRPPELAARAPERKNAPASKKAPDAPRRAEAKAPAEKEAPLQKEKAPPEHEAKPDRKAPDAKAPNDRIDELLALINAQRLREKAPALTLHPDHSKGCLDHASYLARHLPDAPDLDLHDQDDRPGASDAGRAAARAAAVSRRPPDDAIRAWLKAPAHRALLTDPALKTVGLGAARDGADGWVVVCDFTRGRDAPVAAKNGPVIYPADGQRDVPLAFPGNEVPDPLPMAKDKLAGYPLTATFPRGAKVPSARAWLEDEDGQDVPVWFSSPARPANDEHALSQQNTLCAIPRKPLRAGRRYALRLEATVDGAAWSHTATFVTQPPAVEGGMYARAAARVNHHRKAAGLEALALDPELSRDCAAHARYIIRHIGRGLGRWVYDEDPDWEGYTEGGRRAAQSAAIHLGTGSGPPAAVDWVMSSVVNRHLVLSPTAAGVGLGAARRAPTGWAWVVSFTPGKAGPGTPRVYFYPGKGQKDVPLAFAHDVQGLVPKAPAGSHAGFPITARFLGGKLTGASASLRDADGDEVACWVGTPQSPLAVGGRLTQIVLVPKAPLRGATTYTAEMAATRDGEPWAEKWSFTTFDPAAHRAAVAAELVRQLNQARRHAGLGPVKLDDALSKGCQAHAAYVVRNIDDPKVAGLNIHDEEPGLPGYTKAGAVAGPRSVISRTSDPRESVEEWLATLYHRIPLLAPDLTRVGYGQDHHPVRGWVTVMDTGAR